MIYLVDATTNEILSVFTNVVDWGDTFVVYENGGFLGKFYCDETQYFTDEEPVIKEE